MENFMSYDLSAAACQFELDVRDTALTAIMRASPAVHCVTLHINV